MTEVEIKEVDDKIDWESVPKECLRLRGTTGGTIHWRLPYLYPTEEFRKTWPKRLLVPANP